MDRTTIFTFMGIIISFYLFFNLYDPFESRKEEELKDSFAIGQFVISQLGNDSISLRSSKDTGGYRIHLEAPDSICAGLTHFGCIESYSTDIENSLCAYYKVHKLEPRPVSVFVSFESNNGSGYLFDKKFSLKCSGINGAPISQ